MVCVPWGGKSGEEEKDEEEEKEEEEEGGMTQLSRDKGSEGRHRLTESSPHRQTEGGRWEAN